jgi:uncharacterized protein YlxP (DUF503 family)
MSTRRGIVEFDVTLDERGSLTVPRELMPTLMLHGRARFRVRLTEAGLADTLKERGVTDAEVDAIAACQRESRDQALAFLLSEGALGTRRRPAPRRAVHR